MLPRRRPWSIALAFGIAFVGTLVVAMLQAEKPFYNDSGQYWLLGETFTVNGHFSLLNFNNSLRGYVLPLVDHELQTLAADLRWTWSSTAKLFNVFTFALIGTVLAPAFIRTVWPTRPSWGLGRRLTLTTLLVVFWSGFLNFPLSDFTGLAMALLTLIAVARSDSPGWMLLAGASLGIAVNIRAAYVPLIPVVIGLVVWSWLEQRGRRHASAAQRALCAGLLVVGFATVSLPQSLSAHHYYRTWSFVPGAAVLEPASMYYTVGMSVQGYDTYVGDGDQTTAMNYGYPAGQRLLDRQRQGKITSTSQYVGLFVSHPLVMGGLIARHIVNGLDPLYSTPYVENLHNGWRVWMRIASFALLFLALLRVLWPAARRLLGPGRLRYLLALCACCLTTLPSSMERRYMLPVYLLSYLLALTPGWPNPIRSLESGVRRVQTVAILAVVFSAFASAVWYITNDATSHLTFGTPTYFRPGSNP